MQEKIEPQERICLRIPESVLRKIDELGRIAGSLENKGLQQMRRVIFLESVSDFLQRASEESPEFAEFCRKQEEELSRKEEDERNTKPKRKAKLQPKFLEIEGEGIGPLKKAGELRKQERKARKRLLTSASSMLSLGTNASYPKDSFPDSRRELSYILGIRIREVRKRMQKLRELRDKEAFSSEG